MKITRCSFFTTNHLPIKITRDFSEILIVLKISLVFQIPPSKQLKYCTRLFLCGVSPMIETSPIKSSPTSKRLYFSLWGFLPIHKYLHTTTQQHKMIEIPPFFLIPYNDSTLLLTKPTPNPHKLKKDCIFPSETSSKPKPISPIRLPSPSYLPFYWKTPWNYSWRLYHLPN